MMIYDIIIQANAFRLPIFREMLKGGSGMSDTHFENVKSVTNVGEGRTEIVYRSSEGEQKRTVISVPVDVVEQQLHQRGIFPRLECEG